MFLMLRKQGATGAFDCAEQTCAQAYENVGYLHG